MKSKKEVKQFILDTLLPYKENPELCGFNGKGCEYKTKYGKKCAVGKWMNDGEWQQYDNDAEDLFDIYPMDKVLKKEALDMQFDASEWKAIQRYHDNMAGDVAVILLDASVDHLEEKFSIKLPELRI